LHTSRKKSPKIKISKPENEKLTRDEELYSLSLSLSLSSLSLSNENCTQMKWNEMAYLGSESWK
jgi:hypothetical protein